MTTKAELNDVKFDDIHELSKTMRGPDVAEVLALGGMTPQQALTLGCLTSPDRVAAKDELGRVIMIAGVTEHSKIWMLSSLLIEDYAFQIAREAPEWLDDMGRKYGKLSNWVMKENKVHVRLLRHLGFTLGEAVEGVGAHSVTAIPFER